MIEINGYKATEQLYESQGSLIYRAIRDSDKQPVVLKILKQTYPPPAEIARFEREYQITQTLHDAGIIQAFELNKQHNIWYMSVEDFGAQSLAQLLSSDWCPAGYLTVKQFLALALQIVTALEHIHANNIIHKDLNPANILYNPQQNSLKIIDFGISAELSRENPSICTLNVLEGTLAYISPEQTGRMNRNMDYRTDMYSLGVTFYELLTGTVPFNAQDPMELVHCHIAKQAQAVHELNPEIPLMLERIIAKLMTKTAEQRYQSSLGLKMDLQRCLQDLETQGEIREFNLGQEDLFGYFQIPQKLYGREAEIAALMASFDRVSQGNTEMMLVAGYSGIGKSAVVHEIHKPIVAKRGFFIAGKFDQFKRNIPYDSLLQAFSELIRQLLTEPAAKIEQWKQKILANVGNNGQVLVEMMPDLALLIGEQPAVPALPPTESQNRFNAVFQKFISTFADANHPLVVFLDDLQWADQPSLHLINLLMTSSGYPHILIIGAYRDNEVNAAHPLMVMLDEIQKDHARVERLTLAPLNLVHSNTLIAETLHSDNERTLDLAQLCWQKTQGNPFFLNQFLHSIYDSGFITFDPVAKQWQWDTAEIQHSDITDNVVDLMLNQLQKLPATTQNVLQLAACIGNQFELKTLAIVYENGLLNTANDLWAGLQASYVLPLADDYKFLHADDQEADIVYRFLHDRVQQAAYALVDNSELPSIHLKIGRLLWRNSSQAALDENIFAVVGHLNAGRALIVEADEEINLAAFNLQAGRRAKQAAAYQAAFNYFQIGIDLLPEQAWQTQYQLMLDLHRDCAEAAYLSGHFDHAETLYHQAIQHIDNVVDKISIYYIQVTQYQLQARFEEGIEIQRMGLKLLGIEIPEDEHALEQLLQTSLDEVEPNLQGRAIADLVNAKEMTDPEQLALMQLLNMMWYASYLCRQMTLNAVTTLQMINMSLRYGNSDISAFGYVNFALFLNAVVGNFKLGYEYGKLGVALSEQRDSMRMRCHTQFLYALFTQHWNQPLRYTDEYYEKCFAWGVEIGDFVNCGYIITVMGTERLSAGRNLHELLAICERNLVFLQGSKQADMVVCTTISAIQPIRNLMGLTNSDFTYDDDTFSEAQFFAENNHLAPHLSYFYCGKIRNVYLLQDKAQWLDIIQHVALIERCLPGQYKIPESNFYKALILAAAYADASSDEQVLYIEQIQAVLKRMYIWAENCPENFQHKAWLIEAELARIQNDEFTAVKRYKQAIESARDNQYLQNEAIGNELCGKFWLQHQYTEIAEVYLKEARYLYEQWGAQAKVRQLDQQYPQFFMKPAEYISSATQCIPLGTLTNGNTHNTLDLGSVMKAAQIISGEIVLHTLLQKLMTVLLENAGAESGYLLLKDAAHWKIQAQSHAEQDDIQVLQALPIESEGTPLLSTAIINYVEQTQQAVVLADASNEERFSRDPYIIAQQPKSILCSPILHQNQLTGLVYLENNLTTGAFTPKHLEILTLLSSQTAIALENAYLYAHLEDKVQQRTVELEHAHRQILSLEKATTEKQMAGGFAHEIRNALVGPKIIVEKNLGLDRHPPVSVSTTNSREMKAIYLQLQPLLNGEQLAPILAAMQRIFANEERTEQGMQKMHASLSRALSITQKIMDYSKVGDQAMNHAEPIRMDEFIRQLAAEHADNFQQQGIQLAVDLQAASIQVNGQKDYFHILFNNLVLNARDALLDKHNTKPEQHLIRIVSTYQEAYYQVQIIDNGVGIPAVHLPKIYDAFFSTKPESGIGLGMSFVHKIVNQYHGQIEVTSQEYEWTCFAVRFPQASGE